MNWFRSGVKQITGHRRLSAKTASRLARQTFILEPILTPSGLIDNPDGPDVLDLPDRLDGDVLDLVEADVIEPDILDPDAPDLDGSDAGDVGQANVASLPDADLVDTDLEPLDFITAESAALSPQFDSGIFTVGDSGEVSIDFLFDGGKYKGELAIFSLEGMDELEPGSDTFINEAVSRALSRSDLGHVVISDRTEGARFSGTLGERGDWNQGDYLGVKTFQMNPGDEFGIMLAPNSSIQSSKGLLFSMATANPDDAFHLGQIADVTGDGSTFVMEDLTLPDSDQDYNDLIFQIRGATGEAELLDTVIDTDADWRSTDLGEALIAYAEPYVNGSNTDVALLPNSPATDQPLIGIIDTGFSANNPDLDYSQFILGQDRVDGDANPLLQPGEGNEHGTHILGLIAATQDNGIGIDGINDDAPIWLGRAIGSGDWADSLVEFVDAAEASGQENAVVNLSLDLTQIDAEGNVTTRYEFTPKERAAIEYARQNDVLIVAAAGNNNGAMSILGQASQEFDNIITVGAAQRLDAEAAAVPDAFIRADYSSYGYGLDLVADGGTVGSPTLSTVGDGIGSMAGSSVAAAQVTGAASQVWAANPELSYRQVLEILKETATDLSTTDWDAETGAGLLNLAAAVGLAKATDPALHEAPSSWIPDTWSGDGIVTPAERAVHDGPAGTRPYIFQDGDRLWNIAVREWGDGTLWPRIVKRDGSSYTSEEARRIAIGTIVYIPDPTYNPPPPPPPPGYYPDLNSLSDTQWNEYTQDNTRFDVGWPDFRDERHLTPESIRNIYTDLSNELFGKRYPVTAGYLLDPGYREGIGKWHSGFDIDTPNGEPVKALVGGTTTLIQNSSGDYFAGVQGDDGKLWIYGHLGTLALSTGSRIEAGQVIGTIGSKGSHLHLEVQQGPNYRRSQSADQATVRNATLNPIKSFWELKNQNSSSSGGGTPVPGSAPARPGEQIEYIIKPGDTLWEIARRYLGNGARWREILKTPNGGTFTEAEARRLQIGRSVYIPVKYVSDDGGYNPNPPRDGSIDGMRPYEFGHLGHLDDTLWEIAERELGSGFRWKEIRKADGTTFSSEEARRIPRGTIVYLPIGEEPIHENGHPPDDDFEEETISDLLPVPIPEQVQLISKKTETVQFTLDNIALGSFGSELGGIDFGGQFTIAGEKELPVKVFGQNVGSLFAEVSLEAGVSGFLSAGTVDIGFPGKFDISIFNSPNTGKTTIKVDRPSFDSGFSYLSSYLGLGANVTGNVGLEVGVKDVPIIGDSVVDLGTGFELTLDDVIEEAIEKGTTALLGPIGKAIGKAITLDTSLNLNTNLWEAGNRLTTDDVAGFGFDLVNFIEEREKASGSSPKE